MKRFLVMLCVLLMMTAVAVADGTVCIHPNMKTVESKVQYIQASEGHYEKTMIDQKCDDCGNQIRMVTTGNFTGHVFCMAENLHLRNVQYHIYIFICKDCHILAVRDVDCNGYDECDNYHAQEGETPPVKILYSLEDWYEDYSEEAVIARWLEKQPTE